MSGPGSRHLKQRSGVAVPAAFALLIGLALIAVGVMIAAGDRASDRSSTEEGLTVAARDETASLNAYFEQARAISLLTANNPGFAGFYRTGGVQGHGRAHRRALGEATDALNYLEHRYSTSIGEADLIDRTGVELVHVARGMRATMLDLSSDESDSPFFAPAFALNPGDVHQGAPFVSPDTREWVIANATPIPKFGAWSPAILNFNITVESFRKRAQHTSRTHELVIVDADTGKVVIDESRPQRIGQPLGAPGDRRFLSFAHIRSRSGHAMIGGRVTAYEAIAQPRGNANHWYVVALASQPLPSVLGGVGPAPVVMGIAGLLLIALGLLLEFGERRRRRIADQEREQRELDVRLGQKLESVGQLAAGIAHEINTPIQFVGDSMAFVRDATADLLGLITAYRDAVAALTGPDADVLRDTLARAEDEADLEYLEERLPGAFDRTADGIERV
ncbi:MAG: hypothetical protein QOF37_2309, partial [Thermoleophilaceae bacterium]|nr:hypothetical protein [Thermoleophilaceae bacterium]